MRQPALKLYKIVIIVILPVKRTFKTLTAEKEKYKLDASRGSVSLKKFVVKLVRAAGGCLGIDRR